MTAHSASWLEDEPLQQHTTWRVGGPARRFYRPASLAELQRFLAAQAEGEPLLWLGLGSNVLVRDGGIAGTVIATSGGLNTLAQIAPHTVTAGAGLSCAVLARFCARLGLSGAEFLAAIPGTLGGALHMNAGAWGGEIWTLVHSVDTIDRQGRLYHYTPADFDIGYRHAQGPPDQWFVQASLALSADDPAAIKERTHALLAKRRATQPVGQACAGSVFKNPPGGFAAQLIDQAGLKGLRIGPAVVSHKHANFIINEGGASAAQIEALIHAVQHRVAQIHGISLEPEIQILGTPLTDKTLSK